MQLKPKTIIGDFFFPPQCLACRNLVPQPFTFCEACWPEVNFISQPACTCCALPLPLGTQPPFFCAPCLLAPAPFTKAFAPFVYNDFLSSLILAFKNHKNFWLGAALAHWLKTTIPSTYRADLTIPVPLHWLRLLRRGYNQAALLSLALSKSLHVPASYSLLRRIKPTSSQKGLSAKERTANMKHSFSIETKRTDSLKDKHVLLIDDVMSSGATLRACAHTLLAGGAKQVDVGIIARAQL